MRIALVTTAAARDLDEDLPLLDAALRARGAVVDIVDWDAPVGWSAYTRVVVRSTWDYALRRADFLAWAERVGPGLRNRADVLRWNTDKRYLAELGVPIPPTTFVTPGARLPDLDGEVVVKPAVSAGAKDTARHRHPDAARAHLRDLLDAGRVAMVQPYLASVDALGETALVYFGGRYSHAIRKGPILREPGAQADGLFAPEDISVRTPGPDERALAETTLDGLPWPRASLTYARVDVVRGPAGPMVLELELAEPSVFLAYAPGAADRFAEAILGG